MGAARDGPLVRDARAQDVPRIVAIYNDVMRTSDAIFTDTPDTAPARLQWLEQRRAAGLPVLAAEVEGELAGFAGYGPFRPWPGYAQTVEHSIHVDARLRRRGVGRALLQELIERAAAGRMHVMIAGIDAGNDASIALHAALGFAEVGRMPEVGLREGRRLDLVLMQRML